MTLEPLVVDGHRARSISSEPRATIDVVAAILLRAGASFLMATRPPGRAYAGFWEFPGGKVEPNEDHESALSRELHEELDVRPRITQLWKKQIVDYPHALVNLHYYKVYGWIGEPKAQEAQHVGWFTFPLCVSPVLPGTIPILACLKNEFSVRANRGLGTEG